MLAETQASIEDIERKLVENTTMLEQNTLQAHEKLSQLRQQAQMKVTEKMTQIKKIEEEY